RQSSGLGAHYEVFEVRKAKEDDIVIALAGNPNTGKSTVFNQLTGLKQHTGNWPGKTVTNAQGRYRHQDKNFIVVDLPGTYSLLANSVEEEVARDFICSGQAQATVVVTDATCLERNLNLVLQIMEITPNVIVCVNLLDEAKRKQISVDLDHLATLLGVPVVGTNARDGVGLNELKQTVYQMVTNSNCLVPLTLEYITPIETALDMLLPAVREQIPSSYLARWAALRLLEADDWQDEIWRNQSLANEADLELRLAQATTYLREQQIDKDKLHDSVVSNLVNAAEQIAGSVVGLGNRDYNLLDRKVDKIVTSRHFGIPIMLALLGLVFWLTIEGANYPSQLIFNFLFSIEHSLTKFMLDHSWSPFWHGILVLGVYRTVAWVVAVMLPPMAIFFPLFTLLEDLGYLPRIAFNLDTYFKRVCAHGKQALTMCMGFGCNAAGVVACRIIDSPRERLIATLTNNFVPCNGRFPLLIALTSIFFISGKSLASGLVKSVCLVGLIVLAVFITLGVSKLL
ncbi:MAG TPA: ferrous iron transport protein B, partial [Firmicutes bacterium]|nr:ferrous iron transport protein B [Bacillota bacterium]